MDNCNHIAEANSTQDLDATSESSCFAVSKNTNDISPPKMGESLETSLSSNSKIYSIHDQTNPQENESLASSTSSENHFVPEFFPSSSKISQPIATSNSKQNHSYQQQIPHHQQHQYQHQQNLQLQNWHQSLSIMVAASLASTESTEEKRLNVKSNICNYNQIDTPLVNSKWCGTSTDFDQVIGDQSRKLLSEQQKLAIYHDFFQNQQKQNLQSPPNSTSSETISNNESKSIHPSLMMSSESFVSHHQHHLKSQCSNNSNPSTSSESQIDTTSLKSKKNVPQPFLMSVTGGNGADDESHYEGESDHEVLRSSHHESFPKDREILKRAANRLAAQLSRKRKKKLIEELKVENDDLRRKEQILRSIPDLVVVFDASGKLMFVSQSVERFMNCTAQEIEGTSFWSHMCNESVNILKAAFIDAIAARTGALDAMPLGNGILEIELIDPIDVSLIPVTLNGVIHFTNENPECVCSIRPNREKSANCDEEIQLSTK